MHRHGLRFQHLFLAALLVLPPAARMGLPFIERVRPRGVGEEMVEKLQLELEAAREELRREKAQRDSSLLEARYKLVQAAVLPLSDPTPERSVLWAHLLAPQRVPADTAAIWRQALVGRVIRTYGMFSVLRVQTLLDPSFRVRFQHEGASGILWGTGRELKGRPMLEIRHFFETTQLEEGDSLLTEGNDGVYPQGVLIGFVSRCGGEGGEKDEGKATGRLVVLGALEVESLRTVQLAVDLFREDLLEARALERLEGGRP